MVDGVVARDPDQKELRLLTKLTEEEREIARGICVAFKQNSQSLSPMLGRLFRLNVQFAPCTDSPAVLCV